MMTEGKQMENTRSSSEDRLERIMAKAQESPGADDRDGLWDGGLLAPDEMPSWRAEELGETTFRMPDPCPKCGGNVGVIYRGGRKRCHGCKLEEPKRNAASTAARKAKRRANERGAIPEGGLSAEERKRIREIYEESRRLSRITNIPHHVDHEIPISKGGLHHSSNLRPIPAIDNIRKGDRMPIGARHQDAGGGG
jgi:5-methylcytosine-specific restriction endonuclease McrA